MERFPLFAYLEQHSGALALLFPLTHKKPEAERVHKLRVASRRLQTLLWLIEEEGYAKGPSGKLKKLARTLGKLRELDVMQEDAEAFGIKLKDLKKSRRAARAKVADATSPKIEKVLLKKLAALRDISKKIPNAPLSKKKLRTALREWESLPLSAKNFHGFRKLMKRVRYTLEALGLNAKPLKPAQELLGRAHDLHVLAKKAPKNVPLKAAKKEALHQASLHQKRIVKAALKSLAP